MYIYALEAGALRASKYVRQILTGLKRDRDNTVIVGEPTFNNR